MVKRFILFLAALSLMAATLGDDGLYDDPIFHETFMDMSEDAGEAAAADQTLMLVVEQRGCPYCREMHEVNMARPEIREEIEANFYPVQIDLWGSREVTDFDGEAMEERDFAAKHNIQFTPTVIFFDEAGEELFRMPGYFKPFHHYNALQYVSSGAYKGEPFQRYLQSIFESYEAKGEAAPVWE